MRKFMDSKKILDRLAERKRLLSHEKKLKTSISIDPQLLKRAKELTGDIGVSGLIEDLLEEFFADLEATKGKKPRA